MFVLALTVAIGVPCVSMARKLAEGQSPASRDALAAYGDSAVGDNIVAIAEIDSMSTIVWGDGFDAGHPNNRLHLDIKQVLHGPLSTDTIVVTGQIATCAHGDLRVSVIGDNSWPYVGDLMLFCASRMQHDGRDIWHVWRMHIIGGYGAPGASLYATQLLPMQEQVDCSGADGQSLNNCLPRRLTEDGTLDDILRELAVTR